MKMQKTLLVLFSLTFGGSVMAAEEVVESYPITSAIICLTPGINQYSPPLYTMKIEVDKITFIPEPGIPTTAFYPTASARTERGNLERALFRAEAADARTRRVALKLYLKYIPDQDMRQVVGVESGLIPECGTKK